MFWQLVRVPSSAKIYITVSNNSSFSSSILYVLFFKSKYWKYAYLNVWRSYIYCNEGIYDCTHTVSYVFNYNRKIIDKRRLYTVHFMYNISPNIIYCIQFSKYRTCNIPPAPLTPYESSNMSTNRKVKEKENWGSLQPHKKTPKGEGADVFYPRNL